MKNLFKISIIALSVLSFGTALAKENIGQKKTIEKKTRAGCAQTSADIDLDINNVRAYLMNGGDMWWNRAQGAAAYTVPKTGKANALFAGSIWIGGKDVSSGNTIKVAAQTYRQNGNDYWAGPLDLTGQIPINECILWDKMWKVDASAIAKFRKIYAAVDKDSIQKIKDIIAINAGDIDNVIKGWPARNSTTAQGSGNLPITLTPNKAYAPFVDINKDGKYSWAEGDYPAISGDQYIWWIFNDRGNLKTETASQSIGVEIAGSAFAFSTQDELNDATFYNFNVLNRGTSTLAETYMATWTDADLGYAFDDYVGCDTKRDLGIIYNGDDFDEGPTGYGTDIPMLGVDFFRGPKGKKADGTDTILGMSYFMYYNNDNTSHGNPGANPADHYNYMKGTFKGGAEKLTKTCNGFDAGEISNFAYPNGFTECVCNNTPYDRRFIHSSGPFDLLPGANNDITIGAMFIPSVGGNCPGFGKLQAVDDKAQKLFDEEFKLPFGPQAPDVVIKPFDQKFVFYLNNPYGSNNFNQSYGNKDSGSTYLEKSVDATKQGSKDSLYKFEGYIVYQLKNEKVSVSQLRKKDGTIDETKARIVFQSDIKNDLTTLFNHENDPEIPNNDFFIPKLMVAGADKGIVNNFQITTDAFGSGSNKNLVNYKTYNYIVLAYAQNTFKTFSGGKNPSGQSHEYSESRTNGRGEPVAVFSVSPNPVYSNIYTSSNASYGDGIEIMQVEGKGNGGAAMDLTDETVKTILDAPYFTQNPVYKGGAGPIKIKITDADSLKLGNYIIKLKVDSMYSYIPGVTGVPYRDSTKGARGVYTKWSIERENAGTTETIYSENNIATYNEQILARWGQGGEGLTSDWGFSVGAEQILRPSDQSKDERFLNGLITKGSTIEFADPSNPWLDGIKDEDGNSPNNWIRSGLKYDIGGVNADGNTFNGGDMDDYKDNPDSNGNYERIIGGTWAPYNLAAKTQINTAVLENIGLELLYFKSTADRPGAANGRVLLSQVHSVDIVFTSDRSKWTKCNVVEMNYGDTLPVLASYIPAYSEGNAYRFNLRKHASLEKEPNADGSPKYSTTESGRSWFPGYAVNIETGERLNMMFGEDSGDRLNKGNDMIWNPTDDIIDFQKQELHWGGHHIVYVANTRYDEGKAAFDVLSQPVFQTSDPATGDPNQVAKSNIYKTMMWVSPAILSKGRKLASWKDGIVPTTCKVRLRVTRPYAKYGNDSTKFVNNGWPVYKFNTSKVAPSKLTDSKNPYNDDSKALLANITCVPNPYYAYSEYEANRLTNTMKIINLPQTASLNIYSTDGSLVKTILKSDASTTFVDWDMKNNKGVPIASGMYLIHVKIKTDQGEKETVLKWFGIMRPLDITSF